jgi:hypothetical protein
METVILIAGLIGSCLSVVFLIELRAANERLHQLHNDYNELYSRWSDANQMLKEKN